MTTHLTAANQAGPILAATGSPPPLSVEEKRRLLAKLLQSKAAAPAQYAPSLTQERLWFLAQLQGNHAAYNMVDALRLQGRLNVTALERSLNEIVRRHAVLRTSFTSDDQGSPVAMVAPTLTLTLPVIEMPAADEKAIAACLTGAIDQPFDLAVGPLLRVQLLKLATDEHILVWVIHHIIFDGYSAAVWTQELVTLYNAYLRSAPSPLAALPLTYYDYVHQQRQQMVGARWQQLLSYWTTALAAAPPLLELPTDYPRPALYTQRGGVYPLTIDSDLVQSLKAVSAQAGVTLFVTLQAAFVVLLARYSRQTDLVIGTAVTNRTRAELEGLIGFLANTVALRHQLADQPSFLALLQRVKQTTRQALAHQEFPFEKLVSILQPERNLSHAPLVQVAFSFLRQTEKAAALQLTDLTVTPIKVARTTAKLDLSLLLTEVENEIEGIWEYNSDLFTPATIARMNGHLQTLLAGMIADPTQAITALPMLTATETEQILGAWATPQGGLAAAKTVTGQQLFLEQFTAQVTHTPDAVAVVMASTQAPSNTQQSLTYRELDQRANQLAHHLQGLGVGPEVLVGLCVERSLDLIVGLLGILKAGGAYVPLDPTYPPDRLAFIIADAAPTVLVTQRQYCALLSTATALVLLDDDAAQLAQQPRTCPHSKVTAANLAYVIYTSGSTGRPKGVLLEQRGLANLAQAQIAAFGVQPGHRVIQLASLNFDASIWEISMALGAGATLVLASSADLVPGPTLTQILQQQAITHATIVPTALALIEPADLPDLQTLIVAGEACPAALAAQWSAGRRFFNAYGPTETTVCATIMDCAAWYDRQQSPPIGRPLANTQLYLLDQQGQPVPIGVPGELYVGGVGVARGYLNRPELTQERFISNPFEQFRTGTGGADRLYKTGDLVRWLPNGNIDYLGRVDQQVKLRGFRIELGEIETALTQHPAVQEAVVILREEPGSARLTAYVTFHQSNKRQAAPTLTAAALRDYLQTKLPDYMVPAAFVRLETLPWTPNGKVDRKALPAPTLADLGIQVEVGTARTAREAALAGIWQQVLRLTEVGIDDNFFSIGGDSIASIQVVTRARQAGLQLTPQQLFQQPTIRQLATVVTAITQAAPIAQEAVSGELPLTPIQQWFLAQGWQEPHHFNQAMLLETAATVNPLWLEEALAAILHHHDALRLRFQLVDGAWQQHNAAAETTVAFQVIDLATLADAERLTRLAEIAQKTQTALNLATGPLLAARLFTYGSQSAGRLLLVIHHLAVDGVSRRVLLEDLQLAYGQRSRGEAIQLPPKTTAFRDWAHWLANEGVKRVTAEQGWWQQLVSQVQSHLPVDHPSNGAANSIAATAEVICTLSATATARLLRQAPAAYQTQINDLLLTALVQTICQWRGAPSLSLELEGHGRELLELGGDSPATEQIDLSRTVGWFTSLFPVVLQLDQHEPGALIKSIKEQLRRIPNRGIGYGILRYLAQVPDLMPSTPIALGFNYLGQFEATTAEPLPQQETLLLGFAAESSGQSWSPQAQRTHLLDLNAVVLAGELRLVWSYSAYIHERTTIERLAHAYLAALHELIDHCCTPGVIGYTPSDFPALGVAQDELDQILAQIEQTVAPQDKTPVAIEDIYPLSPSQQGMLLDSLSTTARARYIEIFFNDLVGAVDLAAFHQAWQAVVARHPVLRTGFLWTARDEPLQFVLKTVTLPLAMHDWQGLSPAEQTQAQERYLATELAQGLPLAAPPLVRLAIFQLAPTRYRFIWLVHHILLDGWCTPILLGEVMAYYRAQQTGERLTLPPVRPYRDYIHWLRQRDQQAAQHFWQSYLQGFTAPTPLGKPVLLAAESGLVPTPTAATERYGKVQHALSTQLTAQLQQLVQQQQVTLNTLIRGSWALLLSRYSGHTDVLFGATVAGRPAQLTGVEAMIGLFINTLPIRLQVRPTEPLWRWLQQCQAQSAEQEHFAWCSAGQIQTWSEVAHAVPLFQSLLVFQNYPTGAAVEAAAGPALELIPVDYTGAHTPYPLTMLVALAPALTFTLIFDRHYLQETDISHIITHWSTLLQRVTAEPQPVGAQLLAQIEPTQILRVYQHQQQQRTAATPQRPRNLTEQKVLQVWAATLGGSNQAGTIGLDDNFFDIGGHSLLAVQLLAKLRQSFGQQLPLRTLLQNPTVAALAQALQQGDQQASTGVVALQPAGERPPFYCLPGAGGTVLYLHALARALGEEQPFYAFEAAGLDGKTAPYTDVEAAAAYQVAALQQQQPQGPYYLGGHSHGGWIAFAMAQQLLRAGAKIGCLVILDAAAPGEVRPQYDEVELLLAYAQRFTEEFGDPATFQRAALEALTRQARLAWLKSTLEAAAALPPGSTIEDIQGLFNVFQADSQSQYDPAAFIRLPIQLFLAAETDPASKEAKIAGWQRYGPVTVYHTPGTHQGMLYHPQVETLAQHLADCLQAAHKQEKNELTQVACT